MILYLASPVQNNLADIWSKIIKDTSESCQTYLNFQFFFSRSLLGWEMFYMFISSQVTVFFMKSFFLGCRDFCPNFSHPEFLYLEFVRLWFLYFVFYLVRRFFISIIKLLSALHIIQFALKGKTNDNSMHCPAPCLL